MTAVLQHERVLLGGHRQQIHTYGEGDDRPLLLVLHGGPGFANGRAFIRDHPALAHHFTVVTWDQRGAGASYFGAGRGRLTLDGLVRDAAELVGVLHQRHPDRELYVLGLSWGSELGIRLIQRHPEGITGYIGSGQAVDGWANETLSYDTAVRRAQRAAASPERNRRAERDVRTLRRIGPPVHAQYRPMLLGLQRQRSILARWAPILPGRETPPRGDGPTWPIPLRERIGAPLGVVRSLRELWPTATSYNFRVDATSLPVPVLFLQGRHDATTPSALLAEYADVVTAPQVRLVWFENSGHSPAHDEPGRFDASLIAVLHHPIPNEKRPE